MKQQATYVKFLSSLIVDLIFQTKLNALYGIDIMKKICNHPNLLLRVQNSFL